MKHKLQWCAYTCLLGLAAFAVNVRADGLVAAWGNYDNGQTCLPLNLANVHAIAAGGFQSMALRADGTVVTWGATAASPADLTNVIQVASGAEHGLALKSDGTVVAWGDDSSGQTTVPAGLSNVTAIAAAYYHSLALKADGTVVAWGNNSKGQASVPPGLSNVTAIAAGEWHSLALLSDGTIQGWGDDSEDQIHVSGYVNVAGIAAGASHSVALFADGTVRAWGLDSVGQTDVPVGLSDVKTVVASGHHTLALKKDGTVVSWGYYNTGAGLVPAGLSNVTAIATGEYHDLAILPTGPVQISQLPSDQTVFYSSNTAFNVSASGMQPLYCQWLKEGQPLGSNTCVTGPADLTLSLPSVQFGDAGSYSAILSNALGSVITTGARLIVVGPPIFDASLTNQTVRAGDDALLSYSADGTAPIAYQWCFNGTNLAGETNTSLSLINAQPPLAGLYWLVASNLYGMTTSAPMQLTVLTSPVIVSQTLDCNLRAGGDFMLSVEADGVQPLNYQWFFNGTAIPGQNDFNLSLGNIQNSAAGQYSVIVSNVYGSIQSTNINVTVEPTAPTITWRATNAMIPVGGAVTFAATARGSMPLSFQWRFNGKDIPKATNLLLALTHLRYDQAGYYNLIASNAYGEVSSAKALLSVLQVMAWPPSYSTPTNIPAGLSNVVSLAAGNNYIIALKADGTLAMWSTLPSFYQPPSSNLTGIAAIASSQGRIAVLRTNGTVSTWTSTFSTPGVQPILSNIMGVAACQTGILGLRTDGTITNWQTSRTLMAPSGLTNVIAIAAGDQHCLALKNDGTVTAWGLNNYHQTNVPTGLSNVIAIAAGVTHSVALRADGTLVEWGVPLMPTNVTAEVPIVAIAAGYTFTAALLADGTVTNLGLHSPLPAVSNVIAVAATFSPSFFAANAFGDGSPMATLQPVSLPNLVRGSTAQFNSRFVGAQPMHYQWQLNGQDIPGATDVSLTIANAQGRDVGTYCLVASNALGKTLSHPALLNIPVPLDYSLNATNRTWTNGGYMSNLTNVWWFGQIIHSHDGEAAAQSGALTNNQRAVLQTTLQGPGTLTFWWKVSSEEGFDFLSFFLTSELTPSQYYAQISGETDWTQVSVKIPAGQRSVAWCYSKDANTSSGTDAGWVDEISFVPDYPVIVQQPHNISVWAGSNATLEVIATPAPPSQAPIPSYQWRKAGADIPLETNSTLTIPAATRFNSGLYSVRVFNQYGAVISSNALLTVWAPQKLMSPTRQSDGSIGFLSGDVDGGPLTPNNLPSLTVQVSTNLVNWSPITLHPILLGYQILWSDPDTNESVRFYRILEKY